MTKQFCDLCGNPALNNMPEMKVAFPEKAWSGCKTTSGNISVTEGTWTPYVSARVVFESHDTPRSVTSRCYDLCGNCIAGLLKKMAAELIRATEMIRPV